MPEHTGFCQPVCSPRTSKRPIVDSRYGTYITKSGTLRRVAKCPTDQLQELLQGYHDLFDAGATALVGLPFPGLWQMCYGLGEEALPTQLLNEVARASPVKNLHFLFVPRAGSPLRNDIAPS